MMLLKICSNNLFIHSRFKNNLIATLRNQDIVMDLNT